MLGVAPFYPVRISALLPGVALCLFVTVRLPAQDPGAQQDAEAARERLLKAADQLDNIQANSETTKTSVEEMKGDIVKLQGDVTKLQGDNAALKQQVADLQGALDQFKAEQTAARQTLIDNVAAMIAAGKGSATSGKRKKEAITPEPDKNASIQETPSPAGPAAPGLAPPPDPASGPDISAAGARAATDGSPSLPIKPQKGYYHIVASGETLSLICSAYRDKGVKVTVSEIRRANGLTEGSSLKTGQKLFIPKPAADL